MTALTKRERELLDWYAARAREQQLGNGFTSFMQTLAASRPLQVALALGIFQGLEKLSPSESIIQRVATGAGEVGLAAGLVGYLLNADGGTSLAFDVPDVSQPDPGFALSGGGGLPLSHRPR